jgi:anthranilate phosphoribosyltransferase
MKYVSAPRKELGVRTIFNLYRCSDLDWDHLPTPFNPNGWLLEYSQKKSAQLWQKRCIWQALNAHGLTYLTQVVHGALGLDEISPEGLTYVWDMTHGAITEKMISPADFGLQSHPISSVRGGDAEDNSEIMKELLAGNVEGPVLDFVLMNSAALLFVAGKANSLTDAVYLARESILNGDAERALEVFANESQQIE